MIIEDGSTLLFIGDSITDCGRGRPVGTRETGLGDGYVSLADAIIQSVNPERKIRILNTGISGNCIGDLKARWRSDVLDLEPDWLAVKIGINDAWREVSIDEYGSAMDDLVRRTLPALKGLILLTPYFIEANREDPMRLSMDRYGAVVKKIAHKYGAVLVDTQAAFDSFLAHRSSGEIAEDRVHPNLPGHMMIARALLTGIGVDWA